MMKITLFVFLVSMTISGLAADFPPREAECIQPDIVAPKVTLELRRAYLLDNEFFGLFELVNFDVGRGLAVSLEQGTAGPFVTDRTALIEFKDLNEKWVRLNNGIPPGDFTWDPRGIRTVKPGERLRFRYRMFPQDLLKCGGTEFRLKLYTEAPALCVLSFPFQAVPVSPRAKGMRSLPHPRPVGTARP